MRTSRLGRVTGGSVMTPLQQAIRPLGKTLHEKAGEPRRGSGRGIRGAQPRRLRGSARRVSARRANPYNDQGDIIRNRKREVGAMGQEFWLGATAGAVILGVLVAGLLFVTGGARTGLALKALRRTLRDPQFAAQVEPLLGAPPPPPKPL